MTKVIIRMHKNGALNNGVFDGTDRKHGTPLETAPRKLIRK